MPTDNVITHINKAARIETLACIHLDKTGIIVVLYKTYILALMFAGIDKAAFFRPPSGKSVIAS